MINLYISLQITILLLYVTLQNRGGVIMAKKQLNMKIDQQFSDQLESLAQAAGKTKTAIVEKAIANLSIDSKQDHRQVELLSKQNDQLKIIMSATQAVIDEKDKVIQGKDDLIAELKRKKRGFFFRLFGMG